MSIKYDEQTRVLQHLPSESYDDMFPGRAPLLYIKVINAHRGYPRIWLFLLATQTMTPQEAAIIEHVGNVLLINSAFFLSESLLYGMSDYIPRYLTDYSVPRSICLFIQSLNRNIHVSLRNQHNTFVMGN